MNVCTEIEVIHITIYVCMYVYVHVYNYIRTYVCFYMCMYIFITVIFIITEYGSDGMLVVLCDVYLSVYVCPCVHA